MISGLNNHGNAQQQQAPSNPSGTAAPASPQASSSGTGGLFSGRGRPFMGSAQQSEALQKTVQVANDWMKSNAAESVSVIAVDGQANELLMGAVAIVLPYADNSGKNWLVSATLMVEATMATGVNMSRDYNYGSRNYDVPAMPSDAFTQHYLTKVRDVVMSRSAVGYTYLHAGHILVPRETSYENLTVINGLIQASTEAIANAIEFTCNEIVREMPTISQLLEGRSLASRLDFNPAPHTGLNGLPVRSELAATLSTRNNGGNLDVLNNGNNQPILTVHGFIDVLYTDMDQMERQQLAMAPMLAYQRFIGQYVITDVVSPNGAYGIETMFQSIFIAMQFSEGNNWWASFSNAHASNRNRDIGCLPLDLTGPEGLQQPAIDTRAANFDDAQFYRYMGTMFKPGLSFAMDIEDAGHIAWLGALLRNANPGTKEHLMLVRGAHRFTNGMFPLDFNQPFMRDEGRRTLLGYLPDSNGVLRDVRCYDDYLTMLTKFGANDIGLVRTFDQTTTPVSGQPDEVRIVERKAIVERAAGTDVRYIGKAERYVFNDAFLTTYANACIAANLRVQPSNTYAVNHSGPQRRTSNSYQGNMMQGHQAFFQSTGGNDQASLFGRAPATGWNM